MQVPRALMVCGRARAGPVRAGEDHRVDVEGGAVADRGAVLAGEIDHFAIGEEGEAGAAVGVRAVDDLGAAWLRPAADDQANALSPQAGDGGEIVEAVLRQRGARGQQGGAPARGRRGAVAGSCEHLGKVAGAGAFLDLAQLDVERGDEDGADRLGEGGGEALGQRRNRGDRGGPGLSPKPAAPPIAPKTPPMIIEKIQIRTPSRKIIRREPRVSSRLRPMLAKTPRRSSTRAGTETAKTHHRMIPGTIRQIRPSRT